MTQADENTKPGSKRKGRMLFRHEDVAPVGPEDRNEAPSERPVCTNRIRNLEYKKQRNRSQIIMFLTVLALITVVFVGWEILERSLFPDMSTGLRHFLLTIRAILTTLIGCLIIYIFMYFRRKQLSTIAEQLAGILERYMADSNSKSRFENPHLLHCRNVLECEFEECQMFNRPGKRCWQVMALTAEGGHESPGMELKKCHECEVYRRSCPDKLTELGESFNNLLFLLEEESRRVGRMRAQMLEKEKLVSIGQLASGVAHEVGNPLSSISSIVQMMKRSGTGETMNDQLDLIGTHIKRISNTVRQLVKLARPGENQWERIDIGQIIEESVLLISFDSRARHVDIDFTPPDPLPPTYGFPGQLQQVFINLALNALDTMKDGGTLSITARTTGDEIIVDVQDTGEGIPPELGRKIFEPFFTTKEPGAGTGLGLSVSHGVIQKLGGKIEYRSREGMGTLFTVTLPIIEKRPEYHESTGNHTISR